LDLLLMDPRTRRNTDRCARAPPRDRRSERRAAAGARRGRARVRPARCL